MLLHLLDAPDLVVCQAQAAEELQCERNSKPSQVAVVADEVLDVSDVLEHFVRKYEDLVATEVQLLEVVELVEDSGCKLAEVVVGKIELLQVWEVVERRSERQ